MCLERSWKNHISECKRNTKIKRRKTHEICCCEGNREKFNNLPRGFSQWNSINYEFRYVVRLIPKIYMRQIELNFYLFGFSQVRWGKSKGENICATKLNYGWTRSGCKRGKNERGIEMRGLFIKSWFSLSLWISAFWPWRIFFD